VRWIDRWTIMGGIRPQMRWVKGQPVLTLGVFGSPARSLFGNIAMQLLVGITGADGVRVLYGVCGVPYVPRRAISDSRRHFCQQCGRRVRSQVGPAAKTGSLANYCCKQVSAVVKGGGRRTLSRAIRLIALTCCTSILGLQIPANWRMQKCRSR
jgi:hypothetical protein